MKTHKTLASGVQLGMGDWESDAEIARAQVVSFDAQTPVILSANRDDFQFVATTTKKPRPTS